MIGDLWRFPAIRYSCVPWLRALLLPSAATDEMILRREVLPHVADASYLPDSVMTGYEIGFKRYFYKPQPLRTLKEIQADILSLEKATEGLVGEIIGGRI